MPGYLQVLHFDLISTNDAQGLCDAAYCCGVVVQPYITAWMIARARDWSDGDRSVQKATFAAKGEKEKVWYVDRIAWETKNVLRRTVTPLAKSALCRRKMVIT
jgi:hypothetical protein